MMSAGSIFLIIIVVIVVLGWCIGFTVFGIQMCLKGNFLGIVLLFLGLGPLGLIIGVCLCLNYNKNLKEKQLEEIKMYRQQQSSYPHYNSQQSQQTSVNSQNKEPLKEQNTSNNVNN